MGKYKITVVNKDITYKCSETQNLLVSLEALHPAMSIVGCRQGGCGYCRIKIISGTFKIGPMSKAHISDEDLNQGIVLACRTYPTSDISCEFLGLKGSK